MFCSCEILPIITSDCLVPLLDITILSAMMKESVSIEAKTSIWIVLLARHVNNVLYFFISLRHLTTCQHHNKWMVQFDWSDLLEGQLWFVAQIFLSCLNILHSFKSLVPLVSYGWWSTYLNFTFLAVLTSFIKGHSFMAISGNYSRYTVPWHDDWMIIFQFLCFH